MFEKVSLKDWFMLDAVKKGISRISSHLGAVQVMCSEMDEMSFCLPVTVVISE